MRVIDGKFSKEWDPPVPVKEGRVRGLKRWKEKKPTTQRKGSWFGEEMSLSKAQLLLRLQSMQLEE